MKGKILKGAALGMMAFGAAMASADAVEVTVNGNPISFQDAQPQMLNGRVLVPLRGVFEAIGATVIWDEASQSISADAGRRHVKLRIGDHEANVDGRIVSMDTAPLISGGSTMVPLRFLSQSLGAHVDWEPQQNLVAISTHDGHAQNFDATAPPPPAPPAPPRDGAQTPGWDRQPQPMGQFLLPRYSVIPLRLDQTISSDRNQDGDTITATVRSDREGYLDLPRGTVLTGVIRRAQPANGDRPGMLEVRFNSISLPNGSTYPVYGTVTSLNSSNIVRGANGRFMAQNNDDVNRSVGQDAAIGAGAGLFLGSLHDRPVRGAVVGGILGGIVGALSAPHHASNVRISQGTRLGLILGRDLSIERRDLH